MPRDDDRPAPPMVPRTAGDAPFRDLVVVKPDGDPMVVGLSRAVARQMGSLERLYEAVVDEVRDAALEAKVSVLLHEVPLHARKVRGNLYHLYRSPHHGPWLSLLDAQEQAQANPEARYVGSYRLREDGSWSAEAGLDMARLIDLLSPHPGPGHDGA